MSRLDWDWLWFLSLVVVAPLLIVFIVISTSSRAAIVGGGTNADTGPLVILNNQAASTVSVYSADQENFSAHAAKCVVDLTSVGGTVTVTIYGKDGASGMYYVILVSTAINTAGLTVLTVGPGLTSASNSVAQDYLPALWRVGVLVTTAPASGTVGCSTIE